VSANTEPQPAGGKSPAKPYPEEFWPGCPCAACVPPGSDPFSFHAQFHVCPQCGNKRCPGAANHENTCTGSNAPGQPDSLYADVKPLKDREEPR
jgi:hypothetical protein